jgi:hypothetical protein
MGFSLAKLFVEIGAKPDPFHNACDSVQRKLTATGVAMGTFVGNSISAFARIAVAASGDLFRKTIGSAAELNAAVGKTKVIFGEAAGVILNEADAMAEKFGVVKGEYIEAAAAFGATFQSLGKSQDEAAKMGNQIAQLAMDMRSFDGGTNADAFGAISSALKGEMDPIERYRVNLSAAKIEEYALANGLAKTKDGIDEKAKKMAILGSIMEQTGFHQGDLARTAGDADNQFQKVTGSIQNMFTAVGMYLLPAANRAAVAINGWIASAQSLGERAKPYLEAASKAATDVFDTVSEGVTGLGGLLGQFPGLVEQAFGVNPVAVIGDFGSWMQRSIGQALDFIGFGFRNLPAILEVSVLMISEKVINMTEHFWAFMENVSRVGTYIGTNWKALIIDALSAVGTAFLNLGDNIAGLLQAVFDYVKDPTKGFKFDWKPLFDGFEVTAEKLPEMMEPHLTSLQDQISDKLSAIGDKEAKRAIDRAKKPIEEAATDPPKAKEAVKKAAEKEEKFKSQSYSGADFARSLQATLNEGKKDDTPKKQLDTLKEIKKSSKETAKAVKNMKGGAVLA